MSAARSPARFAVCATALLLVLALPAAGARRHEKTPPDVVSPAILDSEAVVAEAEAQQADADVLPLPVLVQSDKSSDETAAEDLTQTDEGPAAPRAQTRRREHRGWLYHENLATLYPVMFESAGHVADRRAGVVASVKADKVFGDDQAIVFPAADDRKAAICLSEKAGSSRWKMMLLKAQTGNFSLSIHHSSANWLGTVEQQIRTIEDPSTLRIMIVRDPYARLLSGFLDKGCNPSPGSWTTLINTEYAGPYSQSPEEFHRFVRHLMAMRAQGKEVNGHFGPLLEHCGLSEGMRYDLYLKAEEMDDWYPDVATFLGLTEAASHGFDTANIGEEDTEDITDCFYPLTGATCTETSEYLERYKTDRNIPRPGSSDAPAAWQKVHTLGHSHGADGLIDKFYSKEVAELAYLMLEMDLNAFGYPKLEV